MKNKISLIIASCHAYEDVLEKLISQLEKNSFFDLGFDKVILATDKINKSKKYSSLWIDDVVVGSDWGERVRKAFHSTITEQSLLILDDYFLTKKIDKHSFYDALTLSKKFDCLYLTAVLQSSIKNNKNHKLFEELEESTLYKVNTTVGIWRKKSILSILEDRDNPWEWESFAGYRRKAKNMKFGSPVNDSSQIYHYSYRTGGAVYRGCWVKEALLDCGITDEEIKHLSKKRMVLENIKNSKRSFAWKYNFLKTGFKMVGFSVLKFLYWSFRNKHKT